jgi:hypothetical protein
VGGGDTARGRDGLVAGGVGPIAGGAGLGVEGDSLSGCGVGRPGCEHLASGGSAHELGHWSSY